MLQCLFDRVRLRCVLERELLDLLAGVLDQLEWELLRAVLALCLDGPVFARLECGNFLLALADQAQRRALHAPRRQSPAHLLPQQRREVEPDQVIERAPRLLRIDQVPGQLPRCLDGFANAVASDFIEGHTMHLLAIEITPFPENLVQMPGDRLTLAVRVGCEVQGLGLAQRACDGADMSRVALDQLVLHAEVVLWIDGALLGDEIAHVAVRGQHLEIPAEIFLDRLRLGRRFHDDQVCRHELPLGCSPSKKMKPRSRPRWLRGRRSRRLIVQ